MNPASATVSYFSHKERVMSALKSKTDVPGSVISTLSSVPSKFIAVPNFPATQAELVAEPTKVKTPSLSLSVES